jgi:hypothetical protein
MFLAGLFSSFFFLCCYRENIANFVNAEDVERLKNLPMRDFENKVWEAVNKKRVVDHKERQLVKHYLMINDG